MSVDNAGIGVGESPDLSQSCNGWGVSKSMGGLVSLSLVLLLFTAVGVVCIAVSRCCWLHVQRVCVVVGKGCRVWELPALILVSLIRFIVDVPHDAEKPVLEPPLATLMWSEGDKKKGFLSCPCLIILTFTC